MNQPSRRQTLALLSGTALSLAGTPVRARQERTLIIYLTRTRNTQAVAEIIARLTGGDLFALALATPYPKDYQANVDQAEQELRAGTLPRLAQLPDVGRYDRIFIGFPTWAMQMPPPVQSLLTQIDLAGKTVIPFNTHAGYGVGSGFETLRRLAPKSRVLPGLSVEGGYEKKGIFLAIQGKRRTEVERQVRQWLAADTQPDRRERDNAHHDRARRTTMNPDDFKQMFPTGKANDAYARYFSGTSYLAPLANSDATLANVTFEPGCRNNWHIHHGFHQILICTAGRGWYQKEGEAAVPMQPGDVIDVPAGARHWHGAARDSWFSHISVTVPKEGATTEWLEPVSDEDYDRL